MNKFFFHILLLVFALQSFSTFGQLEKMNLNHNWEFQIENDADWQNISLPHTWNAKDVLNDEKGYYRGTGIYKKTISLQPLEGQQYFLYFEGANQELNLYVNEQFVGNHKGGYTSFSFNISEFIKGGENDIKVELSNAHHPDIIPLEADFNFFGGIYRDVWLLRTGEVYFNHKWGDNGGTKVNPQMIEKGKYALSFEAEIQNKLPSTQDVILSNELFSPTGSSVLKKEYPLQQLKRNQIAEPKLKYEFYDAIVPWSTTNPTRYKLVSTLKNQEGEILDRVEQFIGFRSFSFENDGFVLNGKKMKLIGSNRHQDEVGKGFALTNAEHLRDLVMLKEMGINFLRISHYPQDPRILEICDSLGIITVEEIPFVNEATNSKDFAENTKQMLREMIARDRNHPSLFAWGTSNELTLRLDRITKDFSKEEKQAYIDFEVNLLNELDEIVHEEDPSRPSFTVHCCGKERNIEMGYHAADIIGYNKYFGWYEGSYDDLGEYMKDFSTLEERPFFLSEYGAGADPRIRADKPRRFDFSIEWQNQFHQSHLRQILESNYLFGANVWNFADFQAEHRGDAVPKINSKGLVTVDRIPKDSYYFYEAALNRFSVVRLPAKLYTTRTGLSNTKQGKWLQNIEVYSNDPEVELFHNGNSLGVKKIENFKATYPVFLEQGENKLFTVGLGPDPFPASDSLVVDVHIFSKNFKKINLEHQALAINVGAHFYFTEEVNSGKNWLPDKAYERGNYGYIGGQEYLRDGKEFVGSDRNMLGTDLDPIYQTCRYGMEAYQVDLPNGKYEVELHFAQLQPIEKWSRLVQSENDKELQIHNASMNLNGAPLNLQDLVDAKINQPIVVKHIIKVKNKGLRIDFRAAEHFNFLNGIKITQL